MGPCRADQIRRGPLLIRYREDDSAGARPIDPCPDGGWSPDLILEGGPDDATAMEDVEHTLHVRVTNLSPQPIEDISVEAWVCDPSVYPVPPGSALFPPGEMTGFFVGPLEPGTTAVIACGPTWTPPPVSPPARRLRLGANVWSDSTRDGARLAGASIAACCNTHHAQRDIAVRRVATGRITTVAGTGVAGFSGDGGPADWAQIGPDAGLAALPDGGFLIGARGRVRLVSPDENIRTLAGGGTSVLIQDGTPATDWMLPIKGSVAALPDGAFLFASPTRLRVWKVTPDGKIHTAAGTGFNGFSGDGGPATEAKLSWAFGVAVTADGGFVIADGWNHRIRKVSPDGIITTVAGDGSESPGEIGDGGPATLAKLALPDAVATLPDGGFLISDSANHRVRRVWPDGTISTVAGNGTQGFSGDGAVATEVSLDLVTWGTPKLAATPDGGFLLAEQKYHRVRRVLPDGRIVTVAGTVNPGFDPDGTLATQARLNGPTGVAVTAYGAILIADANARVWHVDAGLEPL